jgi:hypothetical protein
LIILTVDYECQLDNEALEWKANSVHDVCGYPEIEIHWQVVGGVYFAGLGIEITHPTQIVELSVIDEAGVEV